MDKLIIEGTNKTPYISFDNTTGNLEISGKSIPENSFSFYQPLNQWLEEYRVAPAQVTTFNVILEYFNTSSSKCLLDLFRILEKIQNTGKSSVTVIWNFEEGDDDMEEAGQDYSQLINGITFKYVTIPS